MLKNVYIYVFKIYIVSITFTKSMNNKSIKLEPEDFYYNDKGYRVFTKEYHLKRGYCCKNGCKHCPYGYDKKTDSFKAELK